MNKELNVTTMKRGLLLTATSLFAVSINASEQLMEQSTQLDVPNIIGSSALHEFISNDRMYYFPVPVDYRALYKNIAQSEWYVRAHHHASLGDEMLIE